MKFYEQLGVGLVLMLCCAAIESFAMQGADVSENTKIDANTEKEFKHVVKSCACLSEEYKNLFLILPPISEFQKKLQKYNEGLLAKENSQAINNESNDTNIEGIKLQAKQFFQKHLGINKDSLKKKFKCEIGTDNKLELNEVLYLVGEKVIDNGKYMKVSDVNDAFAKQKMTYCFDSEDKFPKLNELKKHIKKSSGNETKKRLDEDIQMFAQHLIYRREKQDEIGIFENHEYELKIRDQFGCNLEYFISKNIDEDYLKQPEHVKYDDIWKEVYDNCLSLRDGLFEKSASLNEDNLQNFSNIRKIIIPYLNPVDSKNILFEIVHETGHAIHDASILASETNNSARDENSEAIAIYFETLISKDIDCKSSGIFRLYRLYTNLASIISIGILSQEGISDENIKTIVNLQNLPQDERKAYINDNRSICKQAFDTFRKVYRTIFPKSIDHEYKWLDEDNENPTDKILEDKLSGAWDFEQFAMNSETNKIEFEFDKHTKSLFHVFKIIKQAQENNWNLEKILYELACTKIQKPKPEEFTEVINWLSNRIDEALI